MKKLLLASTAVVMTAGYAAADVTVGGNARMGVAYNSELADKFFFNSRVRVTFALSGETDTGLSFGGSIRADNAAGGAAGTAGSVFISGAYGRLTMGDVDGAAEFVAGDAGAFVGYTELGAFQEATYLSNPGARRPAARYDISLDGFTLAVSASNPGNGDVVYALGVGYTFDGYTVGLGYENDRLTNQKHIVARAAANFDGITVGAMYGRLSVGGVSDNQYGVNVAGTFDATTVRAFYQRGFGGTKSYGVGAAYDLGGGATLRAGVVSTDAVGGGALPSTFGGVAGSRRTLADVGLTFNF